MGADSSDLNVADDCGMGAVQDSTPQEKYAAGTVMADTVARIARKGRQSPLPRYEHQLETVLLALGVKVQPSKGWEYSWYMREKGKATQWQE